MSHNVIIQFSTVSTTLNSQQCSYFLTEVYFLYMQGIMLHKKAHVQKDCYFSLKFIYPVISKQWEYTHSKTNTNGSRKISALKLPGVESDEEGCLSNTTISQ